MKRLSAEKEYYLTRIYHIIDMQEEYEEFQAYLEKKFGLDWYKVKISSLDRALERWVDLSEKKEKREFEKDLHMYWEEESRSFKKLEKEKQRKEQYPIRIIKPTQPRGYKDFSDWNEIGDDFYI